MKIDELSITLLLLSAQVIYIVSLGSASQKFLNLLPIIFFLLTLVLLSFNKVIPKSGTKDENNIQKFIIIASGVSMGAVLTIFLSNLIMNTVLSVALTGIISYLIGNLILKNDTLLITQTAYCGAFIGMTKTFQHSNNLLLLTLSIALCILIFLKTRNSYIGIGGKLGLISFASVLIITTISKFINL